MAISVLSIGRSRSGMAREAQVCHYYSCVEIIVRRGVTCESGKWFLSVRVGSREVAVRAARLGWLAIQDGAKLVASEARVL